MTPVHSARFLIGATLICLPLLCSAQDTGSGDVVTGSGETTMTVGGRLALLAEGGMFPERFTMKDTVRSAWTAEVKRYAERSTELRIRCNEEIRKANRDTIASKASQCLRSDLLLEIGHRRKQHDNIAATPGITYLPDESINAWIDAATSIIDGVDAGVFTNVDMMKEAKRNLHETYRMPMLTDISMSRLDSLGAIIRSFAFVVQSVEQEWSEEDLRSIVACLEEAAARQNMSMVEPTSVTSVAIRVRSTLSAVRTCADLIEDLAKA